VVKETLGETIKVDQEKKKQNVPYPGNYDVSNVFRGHLKRWR